MTRTLLFACLAAVLVAADPAGAVLEGRNGRIAFTSGREGTNDNLAQLYLLNALAPTPLGDPFSLPGIQNRHPSWSPDRTKLVFAAGTLGTPATEELDLFVRDFVAGTATPLDAAEVGDGLSSDNPAWSPDGTRIAYDHQPADNSTERDIKVKTVGSSAPPLSLTTGAPAEVEPAWTPDSQTLYYTKTSSDPAVNLDIARRAATGGPEVPIFNAKGVDDYGPSVSPDGSTLCFTRRTTLQDSATAEIMVAQPVGDADFLNVSQDPTRGDTDCAWSPDGRKIVYVNGVAGQGRLVMKDADGGGPPVELADDQGSNNFDGHPDWAPDASPSCPDTTVRTELNTPVTVALECSDTGPGYERTDPSGFVEAGGGPQHGTTSGERRSANPSTVLYTPNRGFIGTDRIVYSSSDAFGTGTDGGTARIEVTPPRPDARSKCAGRRATIAGTPRRDVLRGTRRADVIVAFGGNDRVQGLRGNDVVCGGRGADLLLGGRGKDRLIGGRGRDTCLGGPGRDRIGCP